ncbi:MAG: hypothetical protein RML49_07685, partial [Verrucomicrobiae bacterium]|nr:hypothetical protein [Verrucomicrobiae bacterium]
ARDVNWYRYVGNGVVNYIDLYGLCKWKHIGNINFNLCIAKCKSYYVKGEVWSCNDDTQCLPKIEIRNFKKGENFDSRCCFRPPFYPNNIKPDSDLSLDKKGNLIPGREPFTPGPDAPVIPQE